MSGTLVEFLRARLDDLERQDGCDGQAEYKTCDDLSRYVLADVEAKRRIIDTYEHFDDRDDMPQAILALYWVLQGLALPHADHPNYRHEWGVR